MGIAMNMKVVNIHGAAQNPDHVLNEAKGEYESVLIIGYDKEGYMDIRASTNLTAKDISWLIDTFKHKLINGDYGEE